MRIFLTTALLVAVAIYLAVKPNKSSTDSERYGDTQGQGRLAGASNQHSTGKENSTKGESPHWYASSEGVLVIVGIVTAIVIGWQSYETMLAARATQQGAEATRDAIEASKQQFAAENRPWIFLEKEPTKEKIDDLLVVPPSRAPYGGQRATYVSFYVKNYGKTPAKIVSAKRDLWIGDSAEIPPTLESFEEAGANTLSQIFPPEVTLNVEAYLKPAKFVSENDANAFYAKTKFAWLCGFISYQDTFGGKSSKIYKTTFCYFWETRTNAPNPFWWPGPNKYNETT